MTQPETQPKTVRAIARRRGPAASRIALSVASLAFFLITLDILIVNVALIDVGADLGGGTTGQQWVIDGYTLLFAALLLLAGNLSDRLGARRALGVGIGVFALASAACALAPSITLLVVARIVQGGAAAIMLPSSMALVREAYPDPQERARALGIWAVGGAVAGAVGPILGGLLATVSWRLVFAINLPVCVVMLLLLLMATAPATVGRATRFDWAGQVAAVLALAGLVLGLIEGGALGYRSPLVVASLVVAVVAAGAFALIQTRVAHPMLPPVLLRPRGMQTSLAVGFAFMVAWFGTVFLLSLYFQQEQGLSPLQAGLLFLPSAAFSVVGNLVSGRLVNRHGARLPVVLGLASMAMGLVGLAATLWLGSVVLAALLLVLVGAGGSIAMPPITGVVLQDAPVQLAGTASAVFNTSRQVGGAVAIAVFGALVAPPALFLDGARTSLLVAACLVVAAASASWRTLRRSSTSQ